MKKSVNFAGLYKLSLIVAAAVTLIGIAMLLIFGGGTFASFTIKNLEISILFRSVVAAVLICALVLLYLFIRFRKNGIRLGLCGAHGAVISAIVAFALCVICRAPLGNMTFAVALLGVCLSFITTVIFGDRLNVKVSRKKTATLNEENYNEVADNAFRPMLVAIIITAVILVGAFAATLIFGSKVLALYALPTLLTAVFSVVFTLAFSCRNYAKKA